MVAVTELMDISLWLKKLGFSIITYESWRILLIYKSYLKRALDVLLVILTMPVVLPVLCIVAIFVRVFMGAPVFFTQQRAGLNAEPFRMLKFRTMTNARGADGGFLADVDRVTSFGKILRKTSIDELPEIWNILLGDMSFVGPRPLLVKYVELYSNEQKRRHEVRPGLTGLAQVSGRNLLSWEKKFELDVDYVDKCSFKFDIIILLKTFAVILSSKGVSAANDITTSEFTGSKNT